MWAGGRARGGRRAERWDTPRSASRVRTAGDRRAGSRGPCLGRGTWSTGAAMWAGEEAAGAGAYISAPLHDSSCRAQGSWPAPATAAMSCGFCVGNRSPSSERCVPIAPHPLCCLRAPPLGGVGACEDQQDAMLPPHLSGGVGGGVQGWVGAHEGYASPPLPCMRLVRDVTAYFTA